MKIPWIIVMLTIMAGCSSPRYVYDFGEQRAIPASQSGVVTVNSIPPPPSEDLVQEEPIASLAVVNQVSSQPLKRQAPEKKGRKIEKQKVVDTPAPRPEVNPANIHADAKRSIIFLLGGGILLLIGGDVFVVVGSLSLLIGMIFGIKWLLRKR